jgi:predicted glycosyltransferase
VVLKYWFDVLTPKQVNFFKPVVDELTKKHDVLCTSRVYREVEELAKLKGLKLMNVGKHGGSSIYGKAKASTERAEKLVDVVQNFQPDCLVSFSSPEASRVAFGLRIRNVGFNDSPHAEAVCRLSIPLMNTLMSPWIIPFKEFTKYGIARKQIIHYKALDPAMWIKNKNLKPIYTYEDLKLDPSKKTVTFRLEESEAAYMSGKSVSSKLLSSLIKNFNDCNIVVLCRYYDQFEYISKDYGNSAIVMDRVIDGTSMLLLSDLFIGSGGTMNCEASLLGIPNMSYGMHNILVNRFLFREGISYRCNVNEMQRLARKMLYDENMQKTIRSRSQRLVSRMEDPKKRIVRVLEFS